MTALDNLAIIHGQVYPFLNALGLEQNREKFTLPAAGRRGYSIDVGSSYGEVMIRIIDNGQLYDRLSITDYKHVAPTLDIVALAVQRKKAALQEEQARRFAEAEAQSGKDEVERILGNG